MILIINFNENDYQYQNVAYNATKKCIGAQRDYVYAWLYRNNMPEEKTSVLLSDVSIEGDFIVRDLTINTNGNDHA